MLFIFTNYIILFFMIFVGYHEYQSTQDRIDENDNDEYDENDDDDDQTAAERKKVTVIKVKWRLQILHKPTNHHSINENSNNNI